MTFYEFINFEGFRENTSPVLTDRPYLDKLNNLKIFHKKGVLIVKLLNFQVSKSYP